MLLHQIWDEVNLFTCVQRMRSEAETQRPVFDDMESELAKAMAVSQRMLQVHSERDAELDHYRHLLGSLQDRWRAVFAQIDLRQRELEQLGRQLGYYRESYDWLIHWIADAKQRQEKIQAVAIIDSKTLKEQLAQEKVLNDTSFLHRPLTLGYQLVTDRLSNTSRLFEDF